jgi:putative acetyltransferase
VIDVVVGIRVEQTSDCAAIRDVHERAFGGQAEANLVELLRKSGKAPISLVAVIGDLIVGHIMFSPIVVESPPVDFRGIGLAPLAVLPECQNRGIGTQLSQAGLEACRRADYDAVVVLGSPKYYPRFGFLRARDYGLDNEYNAGDSFMVMELESGSLAKIKGLVRYAPEFREAEC